MGKIIVDTEACIGCGACATECPDVFEMKDDKSHVIKQDDEAVECAKKFSCPVGAIKIE